MLSFCKSSCGGGDILLSMKIKKCNEAVKRSVTLLRL